MTSFLDRFRRATAWARIRDADRMGKPEQALERLDSFVARWGSRGPRWGSSHTLRAYRSLLLLQTGGTSEAMTDLAALRAQLAQSKIPEDRYIRHFCLSHLAWQHGDPYTAYYQGRQASELAVSNELKRLLWVNEVRHDPEWDAANEGLAHALALADRDRFPRP